MNSHDTDIRRAPLPPSKTRSSRGVTSISISSPWRAISECNPFQQENSTSCLCALLLTAVDFSSSAGGSVDSREKSSLVPMGMVIVSVNSVARA